MELNETRPALEGAQIDQAADGRVFTALAVRSRQGTVHFQARLVTPGTKLGYSNTVTCSQRISGTVIKQSDDGREIMALVTCERCNPSLKAVQS